MGTNRNEKIGDVVDLLFLERFEFQERSSYESAFSIYGTQPIKFAEGSTVSIEVDGLTFYATNILPSISGTNSLGGAREDLTLRFPSSTIYAFTNAGKVVLHFDGALRSLDVPIIQENIELFRIFAERSVERDRRLFKPVE